MDLSISIIVLAGGVGFIAGIVCFVIALIALHPKAPDIPLTTYPRKYADLAVARLDPRFGNRGNA